MPNDGNTATHPRRALGEIVRTELELAWVDAAGAHQQTVRDSVVLGSAEGATLRIADPTVSRLHAEIVFRDGIPWVRDLGSRNGPSVSGVQVDGARLADCATITLGDTPLTVRHATKPQRIVLWPEDGFGPLKGASEAMARRRLRTRRAHRRRRAGRHRRAPCRSRETRSGPGNRGAREEPT